MVEQAGVAAWMIGLLAQAQKLAPGTRLGLNRVGDQLVATREQEVLEPIFVSELQEIKLNTEDQGG